MTAFLTPFSFALLWAVSSLALELPFAINLEAQSAASLVRAVAGATFMALFGGGVIGAAIGLVWHGTLATAAPGHGWRAARRWLRDGDPRQRRRRVDRLLAGAGMGGVFVASSILITRALVLGMVQPTSIAVVGAAAHLALVLALFGLIPFAGWCATVCGRALRRIPGLSWVLDRPDAAVWLFLALALAGAAVVAAPVAEYLPWRFVGRLVGGLALASLLAWLAHRRPLSRSLRHARRAVVAVVFLACGFAAATMPVEAQRARSLMNRATLSARTGSNLLRALIDVDRDGYVWPFGGGDCAPTDPEQHPGALDRPDNDLDENCDGQPVDREELEPLLGRRHKVTSKKVPKRPDIILVTSDALAARHLGAWGYERAQTPKLDAFASRAAVFTHCFSQGPSTRLSLPALFTSRFDSEIERTLTGRRPFPLTQGNRTLAEMLNTAGYRTIAVVPTQTFLPSKWRGLLQGFDVIEKRAAVQWTHAAPNTAKYITKLATKHLRAKRDQPLFLWVHYFDPHSPHQQPKDTTVFGEEHVDIYDAEVAYTDTHMGRLLDEIDTRLGDEAMVIITSDHGSGFDAPRHRKLHFGYDLHSVTLHVPLMVRAPWIEPRRFDHLVSTIDIMPTLADLLRLRRKRRYRGSSLVPELLRGDARRPQVLFHQYYLRESARRGADPLHMVAVRTPEHALINNRRFGSIYLYRWQDDYLETKSLFEAERDHPETARLRRLMGTFIYETRGE